MNSAIVNKIIDEARSQQETKENMFCMSFIKSLDSICGFILKIKTEQEELMGIHNSSGQILIAENAFVIN